MSLPTIIFLLIAATLVIVAVSLYNTLVTLKNRFKNAFAQISIQLQRRYDLIPNLVEVAKKYMDHEKTTLVNVINARNQALSANSLASADPTNADKIKALSTAEKALTASLGSFFALAESYPDLKANSTMLPLMEELSSTENKIAFARQAYNDAVMFYNTAREQFPNSIVANMFNFAPAELLDLSTTENKNPVKVSFD